MIKLGLSLLTGKKGKHGSRKLLASFEELEFEHEDEAHKVPAHLLDKLTGSICRTA